MDEEESGGTSPMPYAVQPTSTAEAQKYARQILDRSLSGEEQEGEKAILGETQKNTQAAIAALKEAQANIASQQYNPNLKGLAFAEAVGQGNRSGSSFQGIASGFGAYGQQKQAEQDFNLKRAELMNKYGIDIANAPQNDTNMKMELQKLHEQQQAPLARAALTQLGRSIVPGASMVSPNGKTAVSEGYQIGTPEYFHRVNQLDAIDRKNKAASAGTDEGAQDEPDHSDDAYKYGVPSTTLYPWNGMSSKEARQAKQTERVKALTALNEDDKGVQQAQSVGRDLDRFMYLNQRHPTGSLQGVPGIHWITGFPDDAKEMDKISARIGPLMRQPGMGRMTNYDLQTFMSSVVGRDKSYEVNGDITKAMKIGIDNQLASNEFMHNFFAVHHTLQGARESWDQYLRDNPIFDPKAPPGSFRLNPGRLDYKKYFRGQSQAEGTAPATTVSTPSQFPDVTDADRNDPVFAGSSDQQIHDAKQPAHARGGAIRGHADGGKIKRDDDYQADLEDLARAFEQGATFQWGDEINAGVKPGAYSSNVTNERGQQQRFSGTHPWTNTGLEVAGGAASSAAVAKAAQMALERMHGKAGALGAVATALEKAVPKSFVGKTAVAGGAGGALAGAGSAQSTEDVPGQALTQGAVGAVAGPLAGLVSKYGVNAVTGLIGKLTGDSVPNASKKVLDALAADKVTADEVRTRLAQSQRLGVPSTMGDVGGPNTQALAQGVATKPGPKVQNYVDQLNDRQMTSNERVQDLVNKSLKPDDYTQKLGELTSNLYQNAKPLYDQAYAQFPKVKSKVLNDILNTPTGAKAAKTAFKLMQDDGQPIGQPDVTGMVRKPSLQYLDYVKRSLDDIVERSERAGDMNKARIVRNMRNNLRDEVDAATTDPTTGTSLYAQARQQYAGDLEVLDALKLGREKFGTMNARDLSNATQNMSYAEKDALRSGVAENLFQQVQSLPPNSNPALKLMGNDAIKNKLRTLFDTDKEYNNFIDGLTQEMRNFAQSRQVISTASQARAGAAASGMDAGAPVGEIAHELALGAAGHPVWMGARAAHAVGNKLMPSGTSEGVAELLGTQAGPKGAATINMLKDQADRLATQKALSGGAGLSIAGGIQPAMAPEPWNNLDNAGSGGAPAMPQ